MRSIQSVLLPRQSTFPTSTPPFSIVILYENEQAGRRARKICDSLISTLPEAVPIQAELFSYDSLGDPEVAEKLIVKAQNCQLVMISTGRARTIPAKVHIWLDRLLNRSLYRFPLAFVTKENDHITHEIWEAVAKYLHRLSRNDQVGFNNVDRYSEAHQV